MPVQPTDIVDSLGYLGIFLSIFILPIPQEVVLPLAGFMAAQGKLSFVYVVISGVVGSIARALPWYYAGKYIGEERLKAWAEQHGRWLKLSASDVKKAKSWFDNYGGKAVLLSQAIPGVRPFIALSAGISKMNLVLFLYYTVCSAAVLQGLLAYAGYELGSHYGLVNQYLNPIPHQLIAFILVVVVIVWLVRRKS